MNEISGHDLIRWGFKPGPSFKYLIPHANSLRKKDLSNEEIIEQLNQLKEDVALLEKRNEPLEWNELITIDESNEIEVKNLQAVREAMGVALKVPVVRAGAIMPDACPAGTAPVGSVIASEMIHPGLHSADICCSVACTTFELEGDPNAKALTNLAREATHFGIGINEMVLPTWRDIIRDSYPEDNIFLSGLESRAINDLGTQGDGNHFLFVGSRESDKALSLVTHHGSRSLGAQVYKRAMQLARTETKRVAKNMGTLSWLDPITDLGEQYWQALQYIRKWTKMNHLCVHDLVSTLWHKEFNIESKDFFWNEHRTTRVRLWFRSTWASRF